MKKFGYRIMALVLVFSVMLMACAAPKASAPAPAQAPAPGQPTPAAPQLSAEAQRLEAAKKEGELVLWTHSIKADSSVAKAWNEQYPSIRLRIWDTSNDILVPKALEEAKAGRHTVDVFNIVDSWVPDLTKAGLIAEYDFPNVKGWDNQPQGNFYRSLNGGPRVPAYNTRLVTAAEAPKTYAEVADVKWRGKGGLSTSGSTSSVMGLAYLWRNGDVLDWDRATKYYETLMKNVNPMTASGFGSLLERLVAGEISIFLFASNGLTTMMYKQGGPVAFAEFKEPLVSTPDALLLAKNAPHPNAARLFVDWLTQPKNAMAMAEEGGEMSYVPNAGQAVTGNRLMKDVKLFQIPAAVLNDPKNVEKSRTAWAQTVQARR